MASILAIVCQQEKTVLASVLFNALSSVGFPCLAQHLAQHARILQASDRLQITSDLALLRTNNQSD
jgi:hypothetical protein